ncbi:MAG TPA: HDOD domain-containing protein [Gemmatimonadaceae bacterium]|nr:HDOD domain-containing protein [Gemmatimonadaceae bacterium]
MLDIFVARQPIFDRQDRLVAYELLYRGNPSATHAVGVDSTQMSTDTIVQTLLGMGFERVVADKQAFVNIDRNVLLESRFDLLDPRSVVLELLESVACDDETRAACEALVRRGYTLALDDFVYSPAYDPLLRIARIVKVDVLDRPVEDLQLLLQELARFDVRCLAERVENAEVHAQCAALGFELFQGYFYARPEILSGREVPVQQANILRLLNLLRDADASDQQLEDAFRGDLLLTYKLLRIVNSAAVGAKGVESIRHAIQLLGRGALHRWLALVLVSSLATGSGTQNELVTMAMQRARLCELVAEALGRRGEGGALFMVGLFSLLDALMRAPMAELLARLDLSDDLRRVLLTREGRYAPMLRLVEAYETARWDDLFAEAAALGLDAGQVPELYAQAVAWAREQAESME